MKCDFIPISGEIEVFSPTDFGWEQHWQNSAGLFEAKVCQIFDDNLELFYQKICRENSVSLDCYIGSLTLTPYAQKYAQLKNGVTDLVVTLKNNPELAGRMSEVLSFSKKRGISRRNFIKKYLMAIPEFRALLVLAESELAETWITLLGLIKKATSWFCSRFLKLLKKSPKKSASSVSFSHFEGENEKLWPLLMAFKNP